MSRLLVGSVIVLVVVVGAILILIGTLDGGDSDTGSRTLAPAPVERHAVVTTLSAP